VATTPALSPRAEWSLLLCLAAIQFTHITDFVILMPLGPQFLRVFQITPAQFSLLVSAYTVSAAVFSLAAAFFLDRLDRKTALLAIYSGFVVATCLCGLAQTYPQLLLARTAAGAFGGTVNAISLAIVGDLIAEQRRGRAMGILMAAFSAATVAGLPLGIAIAAHLGWQWVFLGIGLAGVVLLFVGYWRIPSVRGHLQVGVREAPWKEWRNIFGSGPRVRGLAFICSVMGAGFLIIPFLSPSLVANVGVREQDLSLIYFVGGICTLVTSQVIGWASDRWGARVVFQVVAAVSILPMLWMTHLPALHLWQVLPFSALFMIFVSGRMVPTMAILSSLVPNAERGAYMGLVTFFQQLSMGIASFVAGHLVSLGPTGRLEGYGWAGYMAGVLTLVSLALSRKLAQPLQKR
jgi:predicted MFS family arabinose efflux permease